jgi:exopolysaccharide biosynthesis polyprenyl glycosylphosphotransferase
VNSTVWEQPSRALGAKTVARVAELRTRLLGLSVLADVVIALFSYELARIVFGWAHDSSLHVVPESLDWGFPIGVAAILTAFVWVGLYKLEVYVERPLHLSRIARGSIIALVVTAFLSFALKSPLVSESRLTVFLAFFLFFVIDSLVRVAWLDRLYKADVRERRGATVVVGWLSDGGVLLSRLKELRGFAQVRSLEPKDRRRNGNDAEQELVDTLLLSEPAPRHVFLDAGSLGHKAMLDLVDVARSRGSEVYVIGRLTGVLDTTGLLFRLFETPVMRVHDMPTAGGRLSRRKRSFDVAGALAALALFSPLFALCALLVKLTSRGPVFYRQTRVGLHGREFEFLKFRSMTVGNDDAEYRRHMLDRIGGKADAGSVDEFGRAVLKQGGDARITRVGRYLRRFSLDELPQFWNVLRGDMSMVGPRPALPYEVEAYTQYQRLRLSVMPGVTGLWQVAGRSRVAFDDMVFQDVVYSYNATLLTDVNLCLRTVPAMVSGRGAA